MQELWELQADYESYFSFLPDDIVLYCIEPYLKYEMSAENLLGYSFKDKKVVPSIPKPIIRRKNPTVQTPVSVELFTERYQYHLLLREAMFEYFLDNIGMDYLTFQSLTNIEGLTSKQIISINYFKLLQQKENIYWMAYLQVYHEELESEVHMRFDEKEFVESLLYYTVRRWKPVCKVCQSFIHDTLDCPRFKNTPLLICHRHHLKHFIIRGKRIFHTKVPNSDIYINAKGPHYVLCNLCP